MRSEPNAYPGEREPKYPEGAHAHTKAGAQLFANYYFRLFDWGYATNDPRFVQSISLPSCKACQIYIDALDRLRARHEILRGGRITFDGSMVLEAHFDIAAEFAVQVTIDEQPVLIFSRSSGAPSTAAPHVSRLNAIVYTKWTSAGWRVAEVSTQ